MDAITAVFGIGKEIIERIWPDPADRQKAMIELEKLKQNGDLAQISVNLQEAKHRSVFVAGWRPFIGWVCGGAFTYAYVVQPIALFLTTLAGVNMTALPELQMAEMIPVLMGMLGLGSLRTYEKFKGVNHK